MSERSKAIKFTREQSDYLQDLADRKVGQDWALQVYWLKWPFTNESDHVDLALLSKYEESIKEGYRKRRRKTIERDRQAGTADAVAATGDPVLVDDNAAVVHQDGDSGQAMCGVDADAGLPGEKVTCEDCRTAVADMGQQAAPSATTLRGLEKATGVPEARPTEVTLRGVGEWKEPTPVRPRSKALQRWLDAGKTEADFSTFHDECFVCGDLLPKIESMECAAGPSPAGPMYRLEVATGPQETVNDALWAIHASLGASGRLMQSAADGAKATADALQVLAAQQADAIAQRDATIATQADFIEFLKRQVGVA